MAGGLTSELAPLVIALLGLVGSGYAGVTGHPKSEYYSLVEDIQDDRWNNVCGELGPIVADLYRFVHADENEYDGDGLSQGDVAALHLRRVLDGRSDLDDLEDALRQVDEPVEIYKSCRSRWTRSLKLYLTAVIFSILATGILLSAGATDAALIGVVLATVSGIAGALGVRDFLLYLEHKDELDDMAESVDFM